MKNFIIFVLIQSLPFLWPQKSFAQLSINQAQAIFIYNFTRLIEWPPDRKSGNFVIGVYGSSDVYNDLKNYTSNKTVDNQPIVIKKINSVDEISGIHILFVAYGKTNELSTIITKINGNSTLIITERSGGLEQGATINFVNVENKLRYEVKISNATKIGLKYNSILETMSIVKH